jgi:hypothetical protein
MVLGERAGESMINLRPYSRSGGDGPEHEHSISYDGGLRLWAADYRDGGAYQRF